MAADPVKIVKQFDQLKADAGNHMERWDRMAPYIAPSRYGIMSQRAPGDSQLTNVYDSTTMMAAELMAQFIAGHIINPGQRWFNWGIPNASDAVQEWLEEIRDITLNRFATSLFYAEGSEALVDYGGFGTGCLMLEENPQTVNKTVPGFRGFNCSAVKTGRFFIAEGNDGIVNTLYREFDMSAAMISDRWPKATLPDKIAKALTSAEKYKPQFKVVHGVYPRAKSEQNGGYSATGMPWASCWVYHEHKQLLHESGYRVFPAACPRYHRTPGEIFGRGRGDLAFPDTWTLNTAKRLGLEDHALKLRPPVLHRAGAVLGTLRLTPGAPTAIDTQGRPLRDVIGPYETGSRPDLSQIKEEELRKSIRSIFYVDHILALLEVHKSEQTAFEFARKLDLLFRLLGPVYGRTERELLTAILDIGFNLQYTEGAFPPPPDDIFMTDGEIKVEFQNPLSKAQRAGDAESLTLSLNDLAPLVEVLGPQVLDRIDPAKTVDGVLNRRGFPAQWQRNDNELEQHRAARQKQQAADLELARAEQIAGAAGKAAPMVKQLQETPQ